MKKLMVMLGVAAMVGMANAAAVTWSTGKLFLPNADGTFSSTAGKTTQGTYTAIITFYDGEGEKVLDQNGTWNNMQSLASATTTDSFAANKTYTYDALITFKPKDWKDGDTYYTMEIADGSVTIPGTGCGGVNFTNDKTLPSQWTVQGVPEPTSGLLLLLGVAGLALRRRRA